MILCLHSDLWYNDGTLRWSQFEIEVNQFIFFLLKELLNQFFRKLFITFYKNFHLHYLTKNKSASFYFDDTHKRCDHHKSKQECGPIKNEKVDRIFPERVIRPSFLKDNDELTSRHVLILRIWFPGSHGIWWITAGVNTEQIVYCNYVARIAQR